jgi:glucose-6-phosphate 1-epimerase
MPPAMNPQPSRVPHVLRHESGALASVDAHGAHVLSWIPAGGTERLFLSARSQFADGVAIRGGIPVIFPQFAGEGSLPKHGFARNRFWRLTSAAHDRACWLLEPDDATQSIWPFAFRCELSVALTAKTLDVDLTVHNADRQPFTFTAALHTYLRIDEIADARLGGLGGLQYRNSADGNQRKSETASAVAISGEVDRIYFNAPSSIDLIDGVGEPSRRLRIEQSGFVDTVVWNPGAERGAALGDLEPDGYRRMLCVEAATVGVPITLEPGQQWAGSQRLIAAE